MNDLDDMMKTVHFTRHSDLPWSKYIILDDVITGYLNDVKKSDIDAFGDLIERDSYNRALSSLNILLILELIESEEYERVALLFEDAVSEAHQRHARLLNVFERRERMRLSVKARRVGAR
ncbi:hypothetical protein AXE65_06245 [Ventosimonas gracilis]|uniref:Uncharacterized protein n=1 Tax=Ventosimonas gracilis TaxID=1680762 RepID=A0A139SM04_9GAMM|nr:hypothetical protein [Ventosimonas gracilis]KXU35585.1 hypothetical protein AXE65_06245 [Ventosimonas gracilis]